MRAWSFSEAEADVDGIMDATLRDGPQRIVSEDGRAVVLMSERESQAAQALRAGLSADPLDQLPNPSEPE
jgi:hypothetical protein